MTSGAAVAMAILALDHMVQYSRIFSGFVVASSRPFGVLACSPGSSQASRPQVHAPSKMPWTGTTGRPGSANANAVESRGESVISASQFWLLAIRPTSSRSFWDPWSHRQGHWACVDDFPAACIFFAARARAVPHAVERDDG